MDVRLVLVDRVGSPDEAKARRLIDRLGIVEQVEWLTPENPEGYTWRQVVELYRSSDLVVDEFGGCLGLVALEGASCGRPVLNLLKIPKRVKPATIPIRSNACLAATPAA